MDQEQARNEQSHDQPEHKCIGEAGLILATTVWDREDFSDWEPDAAGSSHVFGS
jgi:hypothetical protein